MAQKRQRAAESSSSSSDSDEDVNDSGPNQPISLHCFEMDRPLAGYLRRHRICVTSESPRCRNVHQFTQSSVPLLHVLFQQQLGDMRSFKFQMRLNFHKIAHPASTAEAYFVHQQALLLTAGDIAQNTDESITEVIANVETFERRGSGWVVSVVDFMDIHIARYMPLKASSYIELPPHHA